LYEGYEVHFHALQAWLRLKYLATFSVISAMLAYNLYALLYFSLFAMYFVFPQKTENLHELSFQSIEQQEVDKTTLLFLSLKLGQT
jgi:hypothetical protein